ncbi:MAG: DUF2167 domain-containing protein [Sphingobacteriales bacterium]|nr:MAG: DUF2167 domain-containing protein [Sphingobacteriales bacterium]
MTRQALLICLVLLGFQSVNARFNADSTGAEEAMILKFRDSVNATLKYQHGSIELPGTNAKLNLPAKFKFLDNKQSRFVLEDLWGNLPQEDVLGTVFPVDSDPFTPGSYVFIISYENIGYVKDDDVADIDYDDILKEMKADGIEANKQRAEAGLATMTLVGWAAKPFYDPNNNTLHWAKNLQVQGSDENTLNYTIMLLGRNGILHLNAVASINDLSAVQASIPEILKMPEFVSGSTYKDFDPGIDKVAAWTIGGLVAGKVRQGRVTRDGFRVVLAGPPNVGKSSLLNALSQSDAAIVSDEAGTTRDLKEIPLDINGQLVILIDSAGLRDTSSKAEAIGVERARDAMRAADLVLWLQAPDVPAEAPPDLQWLSAEHPQGPSLMIVGTKSDLCDATEAHHSVSAATGDGIDALLQRLHEASGASLSNPAELLVSRERDYESLRSAAAALADAGAHVGEFELAAEDLRRASYALERLLGRIDVENVLDRLFSSFCIGK